MKKAYVPPKAELFLLAPNEGIAAWDWEFSSKWEGQKYFEAAGNLASGIAIGGLFGGSDDTFTEDGFVIKK